MFQFVLAVMIAFSLIFGGGSVVAAQTSLPDEALYTVKMWSEEARLALTNDPQAQLALMLQFTERRTEEISTMLQEGQVPPIAVLNRLQLQMEKALRFAANFEPETATQALLQIQARLQEQEQRMIQLQLPQTDPALLQLREQVRTMLQLQARLAEVGAKDPQWLQEQLRLREQEQQQKNEQEQNQNRQQQQTQDQNQQQNQNQTGEPYQSDEQNQNRNQAQNQDGPAEGTCSTGDCMGSGTGSGSEDGTCLNCTMGDCLCADAGVDSEISTEIAPASGTCPNCPSGDCDCNATATCTPACVCLSGDCTCDGSGAPGTPTPGDTGSGPQASATAGGSAGAGGQGTPTPGDNGSGPVSTPAPGGGGKP